MVAKKIKELKQKKQPLSTEPPVKKVGFFVGLFFKAVVLICMTFCLVIYPILFLISSFSWDRISFTRFLITLIHMWEGEIWNMKNR